MKKAIIFLVPCGILLGLAVFMQDFKMSKRYPGLAMYGKIKRGHIKYARKRG